ncbi:hypothetical protein BCV72DRAFT_313135, partial [Rhizopus microsporus var. microsporus]
QAIKHFETYVAFLKALKAKTILPPRYWSYDVALAISYIISLGSTSDLSDDLLTAKTAWLLAIVGFFRLSGLARVDLDKCSISEDKVLHLCVVAPKETRQGSRITKTITIHSHPDLLLCPVTAYSVYVSRIASVTYYIAHPAFPLINIHCLFRSLADHSQPIGPERISKHIRRIMTQVGKPDDAPVPKARALGATLAAQAGIAVDDIVVHGNWSSKAIFEQFYRISAMTNNNLTLATLDQQPRSLSSRVVMMMLHKFVYYIKIY